MLISVHLFDANISVKRHKTIQEAIRYGKFCVSQQDDEFQEDEFPLLDDNEDYVVIELGENDSEEVFNYRNMQINNEDEDDYEEDLDDLENR